MTTSSNTIKAIETKYNGYRFRSRTEARWAVFFDCLNIKYEYEKEGYNLGKGVYYLPDFWFPDFNLWVEIKGKQFTRKETAKCTGLVMGTGSNCLMLHSTPSNTDYYEVIECGYPVPTRVKQTLEQVFGFGKIAYNRAVECARSARFNDKSTWGVQRRTNVGSGSSGQQSAKTGQQGQPVKLPDMFQVNNLYMPHSKDTTCDVTIPESKVSEFVFGAYNRQQARKSAFSWRYWIRQHCPRMEKEIYYGLIHLLTSYNIIINRRHGKSGYLALSPNEAMKHLKYSYGLMWGYKGDKEKEL